MQYNLSPETKTTTGKRDKFKVEDLLAPATEVQNWLESMKTKGVAVAANCIGFRKDTQGFLPELMETMYEERKAFKKKMLEAKAALKTAVNPTPAETERMKLEITKFHNFQLVRKIQLNSAYGAIGNECFRYFDPEIAEAITISGQLSIRWIENSLNRFLNKTLKTEGKDYIIASDTDSVYIRLGDIVKQVMPKETDPQKITKFLNRFCNEVLQPLIDKEFTRLAEQQGAYAQKMRMKREGICSKGIWTAKKRYMLSVWMGEDDVLLSKPETKIMGLETAKSSTPEIVREALKKSISIIMEGTETELREFVAGFKEQFYASSVEQIAFPRGCNGLKEYRDDTTIYRKSTPLHVKGALIYNHWLRDKDLTKRYPKIGDGEKIKYVYLKVPNPVRDKVISFTAGIPKEFGLEAKYIDYDTQFEKSFEEPLSVILKIIGWQMREVSSLEGLFTWT